MKINFGLLGLAAAQSGDDRWEDSSYDYNDSGADRWSNENSWSLDEATAGVTFGVMERVTKQQNSEHFQKALKLSCWNSNMIRDMNNDNKFSVYFNDQVEYKRFTPTTGQADTTTGFDDMSWNYAIGDLRTGMNHQYGFENADATNRYDNTGRQEAAATDAAGQAIRNENRLRHHDEENNTHVSQPVAAHSTIKVFKDTASGADGFNDQSVRPAGKHTFRKWGYQSDNVERAASDGYAANTVVYHFGHHDNKDNLANRPDQYHTTADQQAKDFDGFKDDWRFSLRMGGCLYEAARWVYDENSFHKTSRLTYTDDTLFMNDPFNPMDGSDIFGAHQYGNLGTSGASSAASGALGATYSGVQEFNSNFAAAGGAAGATGGAFQTGATGVAFTVLGQANVPSAGSAAAGAFSTATGSEQTVWAVGDCNGTTCEQHNVATPSSGGVFADVHWVHVFNAHIFPLRDVGYYQYDQSLGIGNVNEENDSITSRDGYGYNIYGSDANGWHVLRDVWGLAGVSTSDYPDGGNAGYVGTTSVGGTQHADTFHNQFATINVGQDSVDGAGAGYQPMTAGSYGYATDMVPILTKTRRKIEDFNVVMANPTYEGHGFLNFVATYHDHTENFVDPNSGTIAAGSWYRQVGKRFLSTIGGLTTASTNQRRVCRALKDGIDGYRKYNLPPTAVAVPPTGNHDDPFQAPLGPGAAGNYEEQRCGAAIYENFGDWFLRPAQTYLAYNKMDEILTAAGTDGWATEACGAAAATDLTGGGTAAGDAMQTYSCLTGMATYNYWAFILSESYDPVAQVAEANLKHELWRAGSSHYDRQGDVGRGFAISSFPHNELGKDFRFNIRTLHNMGNGVAKQYYQIQNLVSGQGQHSGVADAVPSTGGMLTSHLNTDETVWSYYFYAVDTIKIAFPEFVARVNHCHTNSHRADGHCTTVNDPENNGADTATNGSAANGVNEQENVHESYPGYAEGYPKNLFGFQPIIIDGVTMKHTDTNYDSRNQNADGTNYARQYSFMHGLRRDDHTRATLHYLDNDFVGEDKSLNEGHTTNAMCSDTTAMTQTAFKFNHSSGLSDGGGDGEPYGYTETHQPAKPCATWCALDTFAADNVVLTGEGFDNARHTASGGNVDTWRNQVAASAANSRSQFGGFCGRVLRIDGLLQTYDELHNRQYGVLQEIWVQLQYAYQETLDDSARVTAGNTAFSTIQSPFPNVFFSAPEVVDIRGYCPQSNMKCRGYLSDQHQAYGGSRTHAQRVHWNGANGRHANTVAGGLLGFGANKMIDGAEFQTGSETGRAMTGAAAGEEWNRNRDYHADANWPWNYQSYTHDGTSFTGGDAADAMTPYGAGDAIGKK